MIRNLIILFLFWGTLVSFESAFADPKIRVVPHTGYVEENTQIPVEQGKSATYVIRRVVDCRNTKGDCEPLSATSRYRLEDSSGFGSKVYYDPDPALNPALPIGWVVNSGLYLTNRTGPDGMGERVVMVRLPDGKVLDESTFESWLISDIWSLPSARALLIPSVPHTGPWRASVLSVDGRITEIVGSDWKRRREARPGILDCPAGSLDAAIPPESLLEFLPGRPYTELHRRAAGAKGLVAPELDPRGTGEEACAHYMTHFWVGKRSDGQGWNVVGIQGKLLAEERVFASMAEAENAGFVEISARERNKAEALAQAEVEAELIRQRKLELAALREQTMAEQRPKVEALWSAGAYKEATALAEDLSPDEYASYIWYSPVSERADYAKGLEKLRAYGRDTSNDSWAQWLQYRHDAMLACEAERSPPQSAKSRWESLSPFEQSMLILLGPPGGYVPGPDERMVFDATAFEWKMMYGAGGAAGTTYDVINVPKSNIQTPAEIAARENAYLACLSKVRSE